MGIRGGAARAAATVLLFGAGCFGAAGCSEPGDPPNDSEVRASAEAAVKDHVELLAAGKRAGVMLRETRLARGGISAPEAVPSQAECRAEWDRRLLDEEFGADGAASWVSACAGIDPFETGEEAP